MLLVKDNADASQRSSFTGNKRNVIMDNSFTSLSPANKLIANKTSLLTTMSNIRRELPPSVKANMLREL